MVLFSIIQRVLPYPLFPYTTLFRSQLFDEGGTHHHDDDQGADAHQPALGESHGDRKSTRLNSSHANISYAVFCLKKKIKKARIKSGNRVGCVTIAHLVHTRI